MPKPTAHKVPKPTAMDIKTEEKETNVNKSFGVFANWNYDESDTSDDEQIKKTNPSVKKRYNRSRSDSANKKKNDKLYESYNKSNVKKDDGSLQEIIEID